MTDSALVEYAAQRILDWYRNEVSTHPAYLPATVDRLNSDAHAAYMRDAATCLEAPSVEAAAKAMYDGLTLRMTRSPKPRPWDELPEDQNPKTYYRARARAARAEGEEQDERDA